MKKKNRGGKRTEEDFKKQCYFSGQTTKSGGGIINPLCYLEQKTYKTLTRTSKSTTNINKKLLMFSAGQGRIQKSDFSGRQK